MRWVELDDRVGAVGDPHLAILLQTFLGQLCCRRRPLRFKGRNLGVDFAFRLSECRLMATADRFELATFRLSDDENFVEWFDLDEQFKGLVFEVGPTSLEVGDLLGHGRCFFGACDQPAVELRVEPGGLLRNIAGLRFQVSFLASELISRRLGVSGFGVECCDLCIEVGDRCALGQVLTLVSKLVDRVIETLDVE